MTQEMLDLIINVVSIVWVVLALGVFVDAKVKGIDKAGRWGMTMPLNPFRLKKYLTTRKALA